MKDNPGTKGTTDKTGDPYRVMVVDDSAVIRGLISRAVDAHAGLKVVATASNGEIAVTALKREPVDVIILDIEMPVMDGLTAIPLLKAVDPAVQIVMASTLTHKNAEISMKALSLGAADYIPKPSSDQLVSVGPDSFNAELAAKAKALGALARRKGVRRGETISAPKTILGMTTQPGAKVTLKPMPAFKPDIIAFGSSTGGPQALETVIKTMGNNLPQPIVMTQHMPVTFTKIMADHLSRQCNVICKEGSDSDVLQAGHYYLAPGDFHMQFSRKGDGISVKLAKTPPENFCRPAVDPMLRSLVETAGKKILTVILTGMGQDGLLGSELVAKSGGAVVAQDEATSVVWGMPGAVATAGICSAVLPLEEVGKVVRQLAMEGHAP
jgi:two-component system chemotaxis response regulator CheB